MPKTNKLGMTHEEMREAVCDYIAETSGVTVRDIADRFNVSTQSLYKYLHELEGCDFICKCEIHEPREQSSKNPEPITRVGYMLNV